MMALILLFVLGVVADVLFTVGIIGLGLFVLLVIWELQILFGSNGRVEATRSLRQRLSNGDQNLVEIEVTNSLTRTMQFVVLDELPPQFQRRDLQWDFELAQGATKRLSYSVRPVERGVYDFGAIRVFVRSALGLIERRYTVDEHAQVKVYPSYLQLRHYGFYAFDKRLQQTGLKKVRRLGHTMEFEQIKEYVTGDDTRAINWKATARTARPMVNQYQDQRAQPVYCVIDKGRLMEMPFDGMSLLDYAINASLVLSYIAIHKSDKAGLVTFAQKVDDVVRAGRRSHQMRRIMEALYKQSTDFLEADFERLASGIRKRIRQRSLLLLMTNFESIVELRRQLGYLRKLADHHVVVVIFFQNTAIRELLSTSPRSVREIYHQTLAEKAQFDKEHMVQILRNHGIYAVLTTPSELTVDTINQYLELKARGVI